MSCPGRLTTDLVLDALEQALYARQPSATAAWSIIRTVSSAEEQLSWLEVAAPRGRDCAALARLAHLSNEVIAALGPQRPLPNREDLPFCHACLFLNP